MADNGAQSVTRAELRLELSALEERLDHRMEALEERLDHRMEAMEERLVERIRDSQTEILRAFHGWAGPMEQRLRATNTIVMGFDERLALLEERVRKIESKQITG